VNWARESIISKCICATHASFNLRVILVDMAKKGGWWRIGKTSKYVGAGTLKPTPKPKKQAVPLATYVAWQWQLDNATDNVPLYMTGQRVFGWNFCEAFLISNFWAFFAGTFLPAKVFGLAQSFLNRLNLLQLPRANPFRQRPTTRPPPRSISPGRPRRRIPYWASSSATASHIDHAIGIPTEPRKSTYATTPWRWVMIIFAGLFSCRGQR